MNPAQQLPNALGDHRVDLIAGIVTNCPVYHQGRFCLVRSASALSNRLVLPLKRAIATVDGASDSLWYDAESAIRLQ